MAQQTAGPAADRRPQTSVYKLTCGCDLRILTVKGCRIHAEFQKDAFCRERHEFIERLFEAFHTLAKGDG